MINLNLTMAVAPTSSIVGLMVFYIAHDALQEMLFRVEGFKFGMFATFGELLVMSTLSGVSMIRTRGINHGGVLRSFTIAFSDISF